MAISFVAAGAVGTGTNPTAAVPAGYQQNDYLLIFLTCGNSIPTTPSGWTQIVGDSTTPRVYIYAKFAGSSESNVTVTVSSTASVAVMVAYRGVSYLDSYVTRSIRINHDHCLS